MIINVKTNVDEFRRAINQRFRDQIPFATARAINDCAEAAQKAVTAELPAIFARPVPFTLRAIKVEQRASKTGLTAIVGLRPDQARYLQLEELGGIRTAAMNLKPATALIEPQLAPRNAYGNIPYGAVPALLKRVAATVAARKANVAARQGPRGFLDGKAAVRGSVRRIRGIYRGIVLIRGGDPQAHGRPGGFYRLSRRKLFPLLIFAAEAHYKAKFGFHGRVGAVVQKTFPEAMLKRLAEAIRTRRD